MNACLDKSVCECACERKRGLSPLASLPASSAAVKRELHLGGEEEGGGVGGDGPDQRDRPAAVEAAHPLRPKERCYGLNGRGRAELSLESGVLSSSQSGHSSIKLHNAMEF